MMENPTGASPMGEGAESDAATFDPTVPVSEASGELTRIHDTLRQELNSFLARENWEEAAEIQRCIMMVLDSLNIGQPLKRGARIRLYQQLGDRLEHVADRQRQQRSSYCRTISKICQPIERTRMLLNDKIRNFCMDRECNVQRW